MKETSTNIEHKILKKPEPGKKLPGPSKKSHWWLSAPTLFTKIFKKIQKFSEKSKKIWKNPKKFKKIQKFSEKSKKIWKNPKILKKSKNLEKIQKSWKNLEKIQKYLEYPPSSSTGESDRFDVGVATKRRPAPRIWTWRSRYRQQQRGDRDVLLY